MNRSVVKIILPILLLAELVFCFLTYMSFNNNQTKYDHIKYQGLNSEMFAIMLQQKDGTYKESESNTWPTNYIFNATESGCFDSNGNDIKEMLTYDKGKNVVKFKTSKAVFCYLYFDRKKSDITINVSTDGKSGELPTSGKYTNKINCDKATAVYDSKYQRVKINSVTSDEVTCNLEFVKDTKTYLTLKSEVENKTTKTTHVVDAYLNSTPLIKSEYKTTSQFSSSSYSSTSGTTVTNAFTYSGTEWSSVPANLTSGKYYHLKFYIPSKGYYQLCYTISKGYDNLLYVSKNTTNLNLLLYGTHTSINDSSSSTGTRSGCIEMGELTTSDYIKVTQYAYKYSSSLGISTVNFYLNKTTTEPKIYTGYRYSGKQPNNWVWFNNEKWRIIGSVPVTLSNGTTSNLVKIIRSDSIGGLAYDSVTSNITSGSNPFPISNITWGSNTLYNLLNNYYYGKKDATGASPCLRSNTGNITNYATCNYKEIGISSSASDYYGRMIKDVYWNAGIASDRYNPPISTAYTFEAGTKSTVTGKIGLMNASDYGYATSGITYNAVSLGYMDDYTENNWLYGQGNEWTLTPNDTTPNPAQLWIVYYNGMGWGDYPTYTNGVRPVVYLDSSVYIISGDGTEANPYQIGM